MQAPETTVQRAAACQKIQLDLSDQEANDIPLPPDNISDEESDTKPRAKRRKTLRNKANQEEERVVYSDLDSDSDEEDNAPAATATTPGINKAIHGAFRSYCDY